MTLLEVELDGLDVSAMLRRIFSRSRPKPGLSVIQIGDWLHVYASKIRRSDQTWGWCRCATCAASKVDLASLGLNRSAHHAKLFANFYCSSVRKALLDSACECAVDDGNQRRCAIRVEGTEL